MFQSTQSTKICITYYCLEHKNNDARQWQKGITHIPIVCQLYTSVMDERYGLNMFVLQAVDKIRTEWWLPGWLCNLSRCIRHGNVNSIQNPSTVTYPTMGLHCIFLPLTTAYVAVSYNVTNRKLTNNRHGISSIYSVEKAHKVWWFYYVGIGPRVNIS